MNSHSNFLTPSKHTSSICLFIEIIFIPFFVLGVKNWYYSDFAVVFFWTGYFVICLLAVLNMIFNPSTWMKLLGIVVLTVSVQLLIPLNQPFGIPLDNAALFTSQSATNIVQQNHWVLGAGVGDAMKKYSNYPILLLLEVSLSFVTSIPVLVISQYLMLVYMPLFVIILFCFFKKVTGNSDLAVLASFLFATNPIVWALTGITAYQGLGYIFVALALLSFSSKSRRYAGLFCLFSIILAMTQPLSSYNLILFLLFSAVCLYALKSRSADFHLPVKGYSLLFLVIVVASYQAIVATSTVHLFFSFLSTAISSTIGHFQTGIVGSTSLSSQSGSIVGTYLEYLGVAVISIVGLLGSVVSLKRGHRFESFLFIFGIGLSAASYFLPSWQVFGQGSTGQGRFLDYAYLYLIPPALLGIVEFKNIVSRKYSRLGYFAIVMVFLMLVPSTVIGGLPQPYYTANSPLTPNNLSLLDGSQWMATGGWINQNLPSNYNIWCSSIGTNFIEGVYGKTTQGLAYFLQALPSNSTGSNAVVVQYLSIGIEDINYNLTQSNLETLQTTMNCVYSNGQIGVYEG